MSCVFMPIAIYNIIEYNSNRHIITILHRFELGIMWTGLLAVTLVRYIEALRMIFGPLPRYICWFQSLWRNCPTIGSLIFMDLIVIVRYLFVVRFKSYIPINENFMALWSYLSVGIWSILYGITFMIIPGKLGTNYYMCTGEDPRSDFYSTKKYPINAMLPMVSLLIYIGLSGKIALHRSRIRRQLESCPLTKPIPIEIQAQKDMKKKTSIPFVAIMLLALTLIIESLLWSFVVNKMSSDQIMNTTLGTFMAYWHNNLGPMLFIWTFLALTYIKNPALLKNLKELLNVAKTETEVRTFTI